MAFPKPSLLLLLLLPLFLLSLFQAPAFAAKRSYIVYLGSHSHGAEPVEADLHGVTSAHHEFLGSFLDSLEEAKDAMIYSYQRHINGFSAVLDDEVAAQIAEHPDVLAAFPDRAKKLHSTHSWEFMGLGQNGVAAHGSLWEKANYGEDVIIANIDSGVWPESKSFSDEGYGPVPARWKGGCDNTTEVACNRKLIGARYYVNGYEQQVGSFKFKPSPRDNMGHGTHTLSTAGGNFVPGVNVLGLGNGTASGGSPLARVASYRVCWDSDSCFDSDILAAFDRAIHDRVDVISVSLGGEPVDYFQDSIAIGSWHAVTRGIAVVCSAGNSGPTPGTVENLAPWIITVGASTLDRQFYRLVQLGNGQQFKGTSISAALPEDIYYPLITGSQARSANATARDALLCKANSLDPKKVQGKIIACLRGETDRIEKGEEALKAGAAGMILCNDEDFGSEMLYDYHVLPTVHVDYSDSVQIFNYINTARNPRAYLAPPATELGTKPAPVMTDFSSQGPNGLSPGILKPDVTAPGYFIIAGYTEAIGPNEDDDFDKRKLPYVTMSGTSMSCPHVSGVVGLLKKIHPLWSPAAIHSAIMTTATTRDNAEEPIRNASMTKATPFSYGAGHVNPNRAANPGLVYDLIIVDYLNFLCASGYNKTAMGVFSGPLYKCPENSVSSGIRDFNYPSITVPELSGTVTVKRRVKNVGLPRSTYVARVRSPPGVSVSVEPMVLNFEKYWEEKSFMVTLKPKVPASSAPKPTPAGDQEKQYVFGGLTWTDGKHYVRSPIVVAP